MPRKIRKDSIRTILADALRESSERLVILAKVVFETTVIYLLFLVADFLILGATRLAFGPDTSFIANLREGVEILSAIAVATGYVFHVISSLRYLMPPSRVESESDFIPPDISLKQLEQTYGDKIQLIDEVLKQLRQQSLKHTGR